MYDSRPISSYAPIPQTDGHRFIRLIELKADQTSDGYIEVELHLTDLNDTENLAQYEALSYVWGPADADRICIVCNGGFLSIKQTLEQALRQLASDVKDGPRSRMLWIDQITINQDDNVEKSSQVALMGEIYLRSFQTIAWLGAGDASHAMKTFKAVAADLHALKLPAGTQSMSMAELTAASRKAMKDLPSVKAVGRSDLSAVAGFLRKPWFTRMWIVQEAVTPKRVLLQCGTENIDFDVVLFATTLICESNWANLGIKVPNIKLLIVLSTLRQMKHSSDERLCLGTLLKATWSFHATDSRDRFYALYGLILPAVRGTYLQPDYTKSLSEVYACVTTSLIEQSGNLDVLELAGLDLVGRQRKTPSWTLCEHPQPDFLEHFVKSLGEDYFMFSGRNLRAMRHAGFDVSELDDEGIQAVVEELINEEDDFPEVLRPLYSAARDSKADIIEADKECLRLGGQLLDKIVETGDVLIQPRSDTDDIIRRLGVDGELESYEDIPGRKILSALKSHFTHAMGALQTFINAFHATDQLVQRRSSQPYPTGESLTTVFAKTLTAGDRTLGAGLDRAFLAYRDMFPSKGVAAKLPLPLCLSWNSLRASFRLLASGLQDVPKTEQFAILSRVSGGRRVAWSQKGYLGLVPAAARPGDVIALLKGGRLPYALRSMGSGWQLVGACYVHGIMEGEAFDEDLCGEVRLV